MYKDTHTALSHFARLLDTPILWEKCSSAKSFQLAVGHSRVYLYLNFNLSSYLCCTKLGLHYRRIPNKALWSAFTGEE